MNTGRWWEKRNWSQTRGSPNHRSNIEDCTKIASNNSFWTQTDWCYCQAKNICLHFQWADPSILRRTSQHFRYIKMNCNLLRLGFFNPGYFIASELNTDIYCTFVQNQTCSWYSYDHMPCCFTSRSKLRYNRPPCGEQAYRVSCKIYLAEKRLP